MKTKYIVQGIALFVFLGLIVFLIMGKLGTAHAFCPFSSVCFGSLQLHQLNGIVPFLPAMIIGLVILISTLFVGRFFCGWVCPIGTLSDIVYLLNPKSRQKRPATIPRPTHKFFNRFKYFVLAFIVICIALFAYSVYMKFCPILALAHPQNIGIAGLASLFIIFVGSLFVPRMWCRYICPYAALMNIVIKLGGVLKIPRRMIHRNMESCIDCTFCIRQCPMQIDIDNYEILTDPNCIYCNKCITVCPKKGCLACRKEA